MLIPAGEKVYQRGAIPCSGAGISWASDDIDNVLVERIASLVFDDEGKTSVSASLGGIAETKFAREGLQAMLADPEHVEDWRVGETIAEAYLTDYRNCEFPWPVRRDERKSGSSLPGVDLVGFQIDKDGTCFAFGEVKTSSETKYPPRVAYDLKRQVKDLRDRKNVRDRLVVYLCLRSPNAKWESSFKKASERYMENKSDVCLYGILIRDTAPNENDLRMLVNESAEGMPEGMTVEFLALYLPKAQIKGIGNSVIARRKG